jgi:hypothetical protein
MKTTTDMVVDEAELAAIEEHLLACPKCVERAEKSADYVHAIRAGIILGNFDLE